MITFGKLAGFALLAGSLALGSIQAAPVPITKGEENPLSKARKALDTKVTIKAENKTLNETIELFKEFGKADIVLDTSAVQMMGMDPNAQCINFDVKDMPLKEAMAKAFAVVNLRYGVTASGLVISTDEGITVRQLRQRVSFDADGKTFGDLIKGLMNDSGANVVIDPRIAKKAMDEKITFKLEDVPLESAVRLASEVAGYSVVRMSNVLFITTEARAEKMQPNADRPVPPTPGNPFFPGGLDQVVPGFPGGPGGIAPLPPGGAVPANPGLDPVVPDVQVAPPVKKIER